MVRNKSDLVWDKPGLLRNESGNSVRLDVSALTGDGLQTLLTTIGDLLRSKYGQGEGALIVRDRQVQAVEESIRNLNEAERHGGGPLEVVAEDLRRAGTALARLTGRIDVEDLLSSIFSEFCIGK